MCVERIRAQARSGEKEIFARRQFFVIQGVTEGRALASVCAIKRVTARSLCRAQEPKSGEGIQLSAPSVSVRGSFERSEVLRARPLALLFSFQHLLRRAATHPGLHVGEAVARDSPRQ